MLIQGYLMIMQRLIMERKLCIISGEVGNVFDGIILKRFIYSHVLF